MPDEGTEAAAIVEHINELRTVFRRRTRINERFIYLLLAATYLLAFGGQYALQQAFPSIGGTGWMVAVVGPVSLLTIFTHSFKQYDGIHGEAVRRPTFFGIAWLIGLALTLSITAAAGAQFQVNGVEHIAYATSCILMGAIYFLSGACLGGRRETILGLWLIAVGVVSMLLGMPLMLLTIGGLSAAGFLACALAAGSPAQRGSPIAPQARGRRH
ncbi:hypothetical protein [Actinomyces ruminicola]|uniref:Uncharacterized protein n=1 Tax=Actinomyces ruminicola TaxID=332524 RepID=A0A1G9WUF1_9ACTO|nr:hypothetical protein [Actinomyces ruminicola]SDM88162.1 hypothetical protein SAMN04487766_10854 [Actinomyces ruminicola]